MSTGGEATPGRGKGGDDASCANVNLMGQKMKKNHVVNSTTSNGR
jgi:hypothetical protein